MVDLLMCGNKNVFDGILTCILSVMKRTESSEPITLHIFTMDVSYIKPEYLPLTDRQIGCIDLAMKRYNESNRVVKYDVTDLYKAELAGCPNESAYCSPYTLIRLLADKVCGITEKILYLDADVMFNRDIHLLYDINTDGFEYAAARDHYGKYLISRNYINAGVLLFNMPEMRKNDVFEKARRCLRSRKLPFADQSALIRATSRKMLLPQRFNDQKFLHKATVIRHFSKWLFWLPYPHTENIKQWQVQRVKEKFGYDVFDDILSEYTELKSNMGKEEFQNE